MDAVHREPTERSVNNHDLHLLGSEIDSLPHDTYRATEGWETIDGLTTLKWRTLDSFACGSCVDEHFAVGEVDDDEDEATPWDFSSR